MIGTKPLAHSSSRLEASGSCTGVLVGVEGFLLLLNYWAANMDDWDPKVTNDFAAQHEVILFDNAGVASSAGETPLTVAAKARKLKDGQCGIKKDVAALGADELQKKRQLVCP